MGTQAVAGFGERDFYVASIPSRLARETVLIHHYSHRIVNNSYVNLGVFYRQNFAGVLVLGYALNPRQVGKIVDGTDVGEYLELNRMWLHDICPKNSESKALSYAIKYVKLAMPRVAWVQSFADERCGRMGVTYQAANFQYVGSHKTSFYFLDCDTYHEMLLTTGRKGGQRGKTLIENKARAIQCSFRQFRYVYFVKKNWRERLRLKVQPYPKPN